MLKEMLLGLDFVSDFSKRPSETERMMAMRIIVTDKEMIKHGSEHLQPIIE